MERIWAAEITVDGALAKTLIGEQFPALSPVTAEPLGAGWDNTVFRVNERFVFRFPRREIAVELLETELKCLPLLGPRLAPVHIPVPVYTGRPSASYPWSFAGYDYIQGVRAPQVRMDMACRVTLAAAVARFLKTLHAISPRDLPAGALPPDTLARLDCQRRRTSTEARLTSLKCGGLDLDAGRILALLDSAPNEPQTPPSAVAHGDLHIGQLLVTERGALAGIIDWGDLHLGHRAVDLAVCHQLLPIGLHDAFLSSYGEVDSVTWQLAKSRAAWHAVMLLASSVDIGDDLLTEEAKTAVSFITERSAS